MSLIASHADVIVTNVGAIPSTRMAVGDSIRASDLLVQVPESTRSVFLGIPNDNINPTFHRIIENAAMQKSYIFPFGIRVIRDNSTTYIELPAGSAMRLKSRVFNTLLYSGKDANVSLAAVCGGNAPQVAVIKTPLSAPDIFVSHEGQSSSARITSEGITESVPAPATPAHRGLTLVFSHSVADLCSL